MKFLCRYGYVSGLDDIDISISGWMGSQQMSETITEGLMAFQSFYNLDVNGQLDENTMKNMKVPRCTVKDLVKDWAGGQTKIANFNLGERWTKNVLTWRVTKFPGNDLTQDLVIQTLKRAFKIWEKHADLKFYETDVGVGDLEIRWESGDHGDGDPFDKSGGTLAHAFFPRQGRLSGDIHFDDDEFWTLGSYRGINLTQVAVHEIGHSLGLEHSNVRGAIMFPSYEGYRPNLDLHPDDIRGIQTLYGAPLESPGDPVDGEEEWVPDGGGNGGGGKVPGGGGGGSGGGGILTELCRTCGLMWSADFVQA